MVALSILSVVLIALGGLMFQVARQTQRSAATTYRTAAVQQASAWLEGLPWDSTADAVIGGWTSDSSGLLSYNRFTTVWDSTPRLRRITVVVVPTGQLVTPPETLIVYRNRARSASPLQ